MKFSLGKIFGNKNDIEDQPESIINDIDDIPLGVSNHNVLYAAFGELGGYYFMQTIVMGRFKVKTFKGAQLNIVLKDSELMLTSDTSELESEYANVSGRYMTRIDFQIEKSDIERIEANKPSKIVLTSDKKNEEFIIYESDNTN